MALIILAHQLTGQDAQADGVEVANSPEEIEKTKRRLWGLAVENLAGMMKKNADTIVEVKINRSTLRCAGFFRRNGETVEVAYRVLTNNLDLIV